MKKIRDGLSVDLYRVGISQYFKPYRIDIADGVILAKADEVVHTVEQRLEGLVGPGPVFNCHYTFPHPPTRNW